MNIKFNKQEWYSFTLLFCVALISGYYTFFAPDISGLRDSTNWSAQILEKTNTVKTKQINNLAWIDAQKDNRLINGDHIYTYKNSQARLLLKNRVIVSMNEDTLFTISGNSTAPELDIKKGIIYLQTQSPSQKISLKIRGRKLSFRGNKSIVKVNTHKQETKISIIQGKVSLNQQELPPQAELTIKKDSPPVVMIPTPLPKAYTVNLISPDNEKELTLSGPLDQIKLQWKIDPYREQMFRVQISSDSNFQTVIFQKDTNLTALNWTPTSFTTFFWRIFSLETKTFSPIRQFSTKMISPPPKPDLKLEPQKIIIKHLSVETTLLRRVISSLLSHAAANTVHSYIDLEWPKQKNYHYKIEAYQSSDMKSQILSVTTQTNSYRWVNPPAGTIYWRIALVDLWGQIGEFSNLSSLLIQEKINPPKRRRSFPKFVHLQTPSHREVFKNNEVITFSWIPLAQSSYVVLFSRDKNFKNTFAHYSTKTNTLKIDATLFPTQTFYWKVIAQVKGHSPISSKRRIVKVASSIILKHKKTLRKLTKPIPHHITFALGGEFINYSAQGSNSDIHFNGVVFTHFTLTHDYLWNRKNALLSKFSITTGKALDTISFHDISLNNSYAWKLSPTWTIATGFALNYITEITLTSNTLFSSDELHFALLAKSRYKLSSINDIELLANIDLGIGTWNYIDTNLTLTHNNLKNYFLTTGLQIKKMSFQDDSSLTQTNIYLKLGILYAF